eukprot:ctg_795.g314
MNSSAGSGLAKGRGTAGTAVMGSGAGGRRSSAVYLCFIAISLCALFSVFECPTADASADHHNTAANRFDSAAAAPAPPTSNKTLRWRPWHSQVSRLPLFVFVAGVEALAITLSGTCWSAVSTWPSRLCRTFGWRSTTAGLRTLGKWQRPLRTLHIQQLRCVGGGQASHPGLSALVPVRLVPLDALPSGLAHLDRHGRQVCGLADDIPTPRPD